MCLLHIRQAGFLYAAEEFERTTAAFSQRHVAFRDAERFTPLVRIAMVLVWVVVPLENTTTAPLIHAALAEHDALAATCGAKRCDRCARSSAPR